MFLPGHRRTRLGQRNNHEFGEADIDEALDRSGQFRPSGREKSRYVFEIWSTSLQSLQDFVRGCRHDVGNQHTEVLGVDLSIVFSRHLFDHGSTSGYIVGCHETGKPAIGESSHTFELARGDTSEPDLGDCTGFGSTRRSSK